MPPKRKAASKSKNVLPKPVEDLPVLVTSNFTARRPVAKNGSSNEIPGIEENGTLSIVEKAANMNVTVVIEKMPYFVSEKDQNLIESESESVEDEEISNKKLLQKKVIKGKPKLKKQTIEDESNVKKRQKRATSADNPVVKVLEKAANKSKKRVLHKDASEFSKEPDSPIDPPKRNQRAASVDILSSKVPKDTLVLEESQKKNKKVVKKQELKPSNTKPKKNTKKVINDEKENSPKPEHNINELMNIVLDKPKLKRGAKKDQINVHKEEQIVEDDRSQGAALKDKQVVASNKNDDKKSKRKPPKSTQKNNSPEMSDNLKDGEDAVNASTVTKSPDLKSKRGHRGKKINRSPDKSEGSDGKNDTDNSSAISPEIKNKRVRKGKHEQKEMNEKVDKMPKPRGGRRAKYEDIEEMLHSPPAINNELIETGDFPNSIPSTLESEKDKKPVVVKRKTKAKTGKK